MNTPAIIAAFAMGLTGSLHCAGMCGPIMWIIPFNVLKSYKKWAAVLLYHLGRISVYAVLGWTLYSFKSLFNPHIQQYISIIAGVILLLVGLATFIPGMLTWLRFPWAKPAQSALGHMMSNPSLATLLVAGALNGILPCGLVYMALSLSMSAGTSLESISLMYAFGMGTIPMLVTLTILGNQANLFKSLWVRKWVPLVLFTFGSLFIVRGMNLGIPYFSPELSIQGEEIKANCCHKADK